MLLGFQTVKLDDEWIFWKGMERVMPWCTFSGAFMTFYHCFARYPIYCVGTQTITWVPKLLRACNKFGPSGSIEIRFDATGSFIRGEIVSGSDAQKGDSSKFGQLFADGVHNVSCATDGL